MPSFTRPRRWRGLIPPLVLTLLVLSVWPSPPAGAVPPHPYYANVYSVPGFPNVCTPNAEIGTSTASLRLRIVETNNSHVVRLKVWYQVWRTPGSYLNLFPALEARYQSAKFRPTPNEDYWMSKRHVFRRVFTSDTEYRVKAKVSWVRQNRRNWTTTYFLTRCTFYPQQF